MYRWLYAPILFFFTFNREPISCFFRVFSFFFFAQTSFRFWFYFCVHEQYTHAYVSVPVKKNHFCSHTHAHTQSHWCNFMVVAFTRAYTYTHTGWKITFNCVIVQNRTVQNRTEQNKNRRSGECTYFACNFFFFVIIFFFFYWLERSDIADSVSFCLNGWHADASDGPTEPTMAAWHDVRIFFFFAHLSLRLPFVCVLWSSLLSKPKSNKFNEKRPMWGRAETGGRLYPKKKRKKNNGVS